jgi:hypothetical protein
MELLLAVARSPAAATAAPTASHRPQQSLITRHDAGRDPDVAGRYQRRRSRRHCLVNGRYTPAACRGQPCGSSNQVTVRPPRRHQPAPGHLPQDEAPVLRGPLRSVTSTRTSPSPVLTAIVTVSPGSPEPLCCTLLPNSSLFTSKTATSPHGCTGPSTRPRTRGRSAPASPAQHSSRSPEPPP